MSGPRHIPVGAELRGQRLGVEVDRPPNLFAPFTALPIEEAEIEEADLDEVLSEMKALPEHGFDDDLADEGRVQIEELVVAEPDRAPVEITVPPTEQLTTTDDLADRFETPPDQSAPDEFESDEDPAGDQPEVLLPVIRSRQAGMTPPEDSKFKVPYFHLIPPKEGIEDAYSRTLSAMAPEREGQISLLTYDFHPCPDFRSQSRAWIAAIKAGKTPPTFRGSSRPGIAVLLLSVPGRLLSGLARAFKKSMSDKKDTKEGPYKMGDEEADAVKLVEAKRKEQNHLEAGLRVTAAAVAKPEDLKETERDLDDLVVRMMETFSDHGDHHVELTWKNSDDRGIDALIALPPVSNDLLVLLTARELSTLIHVPDGATRPAEVAVKFSMRNIRPQLMPPVIKDPKKPSKDLVPIGIIDKDSEDEKIVGTDLELFSRHTIITGMSGAGKSVEIAGITQGIAMTGSPIVVIDPADALIDDLMPALLSNVGSRLDDFTILDVSDEDFVPAINPLDIKSKEDIDPGAAQVLVMLDQQGLSDGQGPRARRYADTCLRALMICNIATYEDGKPVIEDDEILGLLHVEKFFTDQEFRHNVVEVCGPGPIYDTFDFDTGTWEQLSEKDQAERSEPIIGIFRKLTRNTVIRRMFASTNKLDIGQLICDRKVLLVKLGLHKDPNSVELGVAIAQLLFPQIIGSVHRWSKLYGGPGCVVIVDEAPAMFRNNPEIPKILSQYRKHGLALLLAAQFIDQFESQQKDEVLANTSTKIVLTADPNKSGGLDKSLSGGGTVVTTTELGDIHPFTAISKVLVQSGPKLLPSGAFTMSTLPPEFFGPLRDTSVERERMIANSRALLYQPKALIERRLEGNLLVEGPKRALIEYNRRLPESPDGPAMFPTSSKQAPSDPPIEDEGAETSDFDWPATSKEDPDADGWDT